MPTYDYICDSCGHEFEAYERITSQPQTECPECKLPQLRRKIGPGAVILFKGSGFYQTDYRSDSYKKAAQAEKTANEPPKSTTESAKSEPTSTPQSQSQSEPAKPASTSSKSES